MKKKTEYQNCGCQKRISLVKRLLELICGTGVRLRHEGGVRTRKVRKENDEFNQTVGMFNYAQADKRSISLRATVWAKKKHLFICFS